MPSGMRTSVRVVDTEWLQAELASGRAIESIAREVTRDPSTVAYWAQKYGLRSAHAARHGARGEVDRELLAELVACRLSLRDMADVLQRSPTTVRHWLAKHDLTTSASARRRAAKIAASAGVRKPHLPCPTHGVAPHAPRGDGTFRCIRCRSEQVAARRRRVKRQLVVEAGGACVLCGYGRCVAALQFHHVDPDAKQFGISRRGVTRAIAEAREEAAKCVLLCANCHAEVESGFAALPLGSTD